MHEEGATLTVESTARKLVGAWRLFVRDPKGLSNFDLSVGSFWRSFFAAVIGVPLFFFITMSEIVILADLGVAPPPADALSPAFLTAEITAYALSWVLFALIMVPVCRMVGLEASYVPYIIVFNWACLLSLILFTAPSVLYHLELIGASSTAYFSLGIIVVTALYQYYLTRLVLGATEPVSLLVVLMNYTLVLVIGQVATLAQA